MAEETEVEVEMNFVESRKCSFLPAQLNITPMLSQLRTR